MQIVKEKCQNIEEMAKKILEKDPRARMNDKKLVLF